MTKMKDRNAQLKSALGAMAKKEVVREVASIPREDTVNRQGHVAYSLDDELRLLTMLNTLKIQPQFYRSESETMVELRDLVEKVGLKDPKFLAQSIVWSRCMGEGMRSINHLAAALAAPFVSGQPWSKAFYGAFNKNKKQGGCIFRLDDMTEIKDVFAALNPRESGKHKHKSLPNAMKKGFASVLENADANLLLKYKDTVIDIANLSHPSAELAKAEVTLQNGEVVKVLNAIMSGLNVKADTWETANSEAGQEVAKAVREGKITQEEGAKILAEAKNDNWEGLLNDGKLGVLAALRNIRNMMKSPRKTVIDAWCKLITNKDLVRKALILPCHFDLAYEVVMDEFATADYSPKVQQALLDGYEAAIPNLKDALPGRTCIMVDCSGSMGWAGAILEDSYKKGSRVTTSCRSRETRSCAYKAGLVAATIAKATGADVVKFGGHAYDFKYKANTNVFALAREIGTSDDGWTNPACAFDLIRDGRRAYDRIIFISDNEVNGRITSESYKRYIHDVCSPYIYAVDLAAYGTTPLKNEGKVNYYFGYGSSLFEDIASKEFNPMQHIEKVRKVVIDPNCE